MFRTVLKYFGIAILGIILGLAIGIFSINVFSYISNENNESFFRKIGNMNQEKSIVYVEVYSKNDDPEMIKYNMDTEFENLGKEYDYTIEGNKAIMAIPSNDAEKFREDIEQDIKRFIKDIEKEKVVKNIEFRKNYTEVKIDISEKQLKKMDEEALYSLGYSLGVTLGKYSGRYQIFNGVAIEDINVNLKFYIDGKFIDEQDVDIKDIEDF